MKAFFKITIFTIASLSLNASTSMAVNIDLIYKTNHIWGSWEYWEESGSFGSNFDFSNLDNYERPLKYSMDLVYNSEVDGPTQIKVYSEANWFYNETSALTSNFHSLAHSCSESTYIFSPFTSTIETIDIFHRLGDWTQASAELIDLTNGIQIWAWRSNDNLDIPWMPSIENYGYKESTFTTFFNSDHQYKLSLYSAISANDDGNRAFIGSSDFNLPEPSAMLLLGSGLVGLVGYGRSRFKK